LEEQKRRKVLVVDDHEDIRSLVRDYLQASNFSVDVAVNGSEALATAAHGKPDLLVLDLSLPGRDGMDVCRELRRTSAVPILILSARGDDIDKILALEVGADDYLTKPFNPRELVARVQAIFRRMDWDRSKPKVDCLDISPLKLDPARRQGWLAEQSLPLTPIEFSLLLDLARNQGQNRTRQQLLDSVWGADFFGDERTVDAHIRGVRAKLRAVLPDYRPIVSVWSLGYRFEAS
jgi:two-component system response regulator ResD